jgi:hypothetical protein
VWEIADVNGIAFYQCNDALDIISIRFVKPDMITFHKAVNFFMPVFFYEEHAALRTCFMSDEEQKNKQPFLHV